VVGAIATSSGLLLISRVHTLWAGHLTYGIGVGIGVACGYVPMVAVVGDWFERHRTFALGLAVPRPPSAPWSGRRWAAR
jgi:MFS family permease